jgi:hypothetical protein
MTIMIMMITTSCLIYVLGACQRIVASSSCSCWRQCPRALWPLRRQASMGDLNVTDISMYSEECASREECTHWSLS